MRWPLALGVVGLVLACGEPAPSAGVLELDAAQPSGVADRWRFADGVEVSHVEVPTAALVPGAALTIAFEVSAPGSYALGLVPPRAAGRQVALGGPGAPPPRVPDDPRGVWAVVEGQGRLEATLVLPAPWHPNTAVLSLRRGTVATTIPVTEGPRRHDGLGVLAVLDVDTQPTAVVATRGSVKVDGAPRESIWTSTPRASLVESLAGEPVRLGAAREDAPDWGPTQVAFAWDDSSLYVAAWLPDRDLRGTFTARDEPIWKEEVFELFIFGDARRARYLELQVSPRGVQFDSRFERYRDGDEAWNSAFAAPVEVLGSVEDPADRDEGWTTELAVPWSEICAHTEVQCPVAPGTTLRVNAFRLERPRKGAAVGLALSPTRVPDFHAPENSAVLELLP
ncbi:MAG: carbohydrate-binding family 9-like protein [Nannocystaceae bacterium]|nr:carbohydrate-binding family 9-like protein [bacterium]